MSGPSKFTTDHNRARNLGSAKHGASHWLMERITSIALVPLSVWAVFAVLRIAPTGYPGAIALLTNPVNAVMAVLLLAIGFQHMHAGMRVIVEDYIHTTLLKSVLLLANLFACGLAGAVAVFAVLKVALFSSALAAGAF